MIRVISCLPDSCPDIVHLDIDYIVKLWSEQRRDDQYMGEMKAFVGLRLMMEKTVVKPRYENYWQGEAHNFMSFTPGFRDVMERDRFLALWTFLHLVDQQDPNIDKSDKIYKVRPMLDVLLPRFRHHYNPGQQLSLDEGMIPTKNRLAIKQYIKDKPIKWGIKCFMLCEGRTGYIVSAEIYTGKDQARHIEHLGSSGSVVIRLVEDAEISGQNHIIFMDRYFNSVALFSHLYDKMGTFDRPRSSTAKPGRHCPVRGLSPLVHLLRRVQNLRVLPCAPRPVPGRRA